MSPPAFPKGRLTPPLNWRDYLDVHPAAGAFPLLSEKELKHLAGDIQRNDLRADVVLWRPDDKTEPALLDGRNRLDALALIDRLTVDQGELCIKRIDRSLRQIKNCRTITGGDPQNGADDRAAAPADDPESSAKAMKAKFAEMEASARADRSDVGPEILRHDQVRP